MATRGGYGANNVTVRREVGVFEPPTVNHDAMHGLHARRRIDKFKPTRRAERSYASRSPLNPNPDRNTSDVHSPCEIPDWFLRDYSSLTEHALHDHLVHPMAAGTYWHWTP